MNVPFDDEPEYTLHNNAHFPEFIDELNSYLTHFKDARQLISVVEPRLHKAMVYIKLHYKEDIRLSDVAAVVALNGNTLTALIKRYYGINYMNLMIEVRIAHAMEMMRTGYESVSVIAHECGYNNERALNRAFRSTLGMNPTEYRKNVLRCVSFAAAERNGVIPYLQVAENRPTDYEQSRDRLLLSDATPESVTP